MAQPAQMHCSECGQSTGRWLGRCPGCGSSRTLVEEAPQAASRGKGAAPPRAAARRRGGGKGGADPDRRRRAGPGFSEAGSSLRRWCSSAVSRAWGRSTLLLMALAAISRDRRALLVTGEESTAQVKLGRRASAAPSGSRSSPRPTSTRSARRWSGAAGGLRDRFRADAVLVRHRVCPGLRLAGAGGRCPTASRREGGRRRAVPGRPRDEGRSGRRAACPRTPGRLRAPVRGRPVPRAPRAARREEPVRLHERARDLRDDGNRARRRAGPSQLFGQPARRRSARRSPASSRGHVRCCSRSRHWSRRPTWRCPGGLRPASTRSASR